MLRFASHSFRISICPWVSHSELGLLFLNITCQIKLECCGLGAAVQIRVQKGVGP